jgi:hypothetical protein
MVARAELLLRVLAVRERLGGMKFDGVEGLLVRVQMDAVGEVPPLIRRLQPERRQHGGEVGPARRVGAQVALPGRSRPEPHGVRIRRPHETDDSGRVRRKWTEWW